MENLKGPFNDIIPYFQKYKKSIGYKYDNINQYKKIDKILKNHNITNYSDIDSMYNILVEQEVNEKIKKKNYYALKEIHSFMILMNYNVPKLKAYFPKRKTSFPSQILSEYEIKLFFQILDHHCIITNDYILPVLFRLIYSCGLRISEAIHLKIKDLSLKNGTITIVKSKNNITRMLPLSDSMLKVFNTYFKMVDTENNIFLFEQNGKKINVNYLEEKFKYVITFINKEATPHSLRHTFAIHTLNNLYKNSINSSSALYPLSVYMGHTNIKSTEYYLKCTNEYYQKNVINIVPKVGEKK